MSFMVEWRYPESLCGVYKKKCLSCHVSAHLNCKFDICFCGCVTFFRVSRSYNLTIIETYNGYISHVTRCRICRILFIHTFYSLNLLYKLRFIHCIFCMNIDRRKEEESTNITDLHLFLCS